MIVKVFSIHDVKADVFNTPFFARTEAEAIRNFTELANDPQGLVSKYPGDYRLVVLATFDDSCGEFSNVSVQGLGFAEGYKRPSKQLELVPEVSHG